MKLLSLFNRKGTKPSASEAGRVLAEMAALNYRERVRARTRLMRAELGLPEVAILEPRAKP